MRSIRDCLNPQLASICEQAILIEELNLKVTRFLPDELRAHCHVASFSRGCLLIIVAQATWATPLRFLLPQLRDQLRQEAGLYQLASIKIQLQTDPVLSQAVKTETPSVATPTPDHRADHQKKCHYPPLQQALEKLMTPMANPKKTG